MIVSVDHDLQPLYLIPIFPYLFTEHYLGDPDNKQMDFDASWRARPGLELSAELFLDDLQNYFGFLSNGWGNKWALGLGVKAAGWTGSGSLDKFQATRIEPWTGTASSAVLPGAPSNVPIHFGEPLGSQVGPNSASLVWIHSQDVSKALDLEHEHFRDLEGNRSRIVHFGQKLARLVGNMGGRDPPEEMAGRILDRSTGMDGRIPMAIRLRLAHRRVGPASPAKASPPNPWIGGLRCRWERAGVNKASVRT